MRLVLDKNLLVSGVTAAGLLRRLLDGAKAKEFELCTSDVLLAEVLDVLSRVKFVQRLAQGGLTPQGLDLQRIAVVVSATDTPRVVHIAAAITGQADLIASGNKRDLLPLGSFQSIVIITAREAVERLGATGNT